MAVPSKLTTHGARRSHDQPWLGLLASVIVGVVVRLAALRFQPFVTFDGTEYIRIAESLSVGRAVASLFPPGYPVLIAITRQFTADWVQAGVLVSMVSGTVLPVVTWFLARPAVGPSRAWLPALVVAAHPVLAHFSALTMSESAFMLAVHLALVLASVERALGAGLAFGAAFAIRPEAIIPYAVTLIWSGLDDWRRRQGARRIAGLVLGFLVLALPCWIYFHATFGAWTLTPKLSALRAPTRDWRVDEPRSAPRPPKSSGATRSAGEGATFRSLEVISNYPRNALTVAREVQVVWPLPLLVLSALGFRRRRGLETAALPHLLLLPFLGLSFQPRFALVAVPCLAIHLCQLLGQVERRRTLILASALVCVGMGWGIVKYLPEFSSPFDGEMGPAKRAGEWIARDSEPGDVVMSRKPFVGFYAGRSNLVLPDDPYDGIISVAQQHRVRYLIIEERLVETMRPQLAPLINDPEFLKRELRLQLVYVGGDQPGFGVAVFKVLRRGESKGSARPTIDYTWHQ